MLFGFRLQDEFIQAQNEIKHLLSDQQTLQHQMNLQAADFQKSLLAKSKRLEELQQQVSQAGRRVRWARMNLLDLTSPVNKVLLTSAVVLVCNLDDEPPAAGDAQSSDAAGDGRSSQGDASSTGRGRRLFLGITLTMKHGPLPWQPQQANNTERT